MHKLYVLVGPTAVGKSRVALELAGRLNAEIVSADSRQVYRHMDIGTAKPSAEDRARIPHHLIDVADPDEEFTLVHFRARALKVIAEIIARGKPPLVVGGTGLYVRSLTEGFSVPPVPPDSAVRAHLEARAETEGSANLYRELAEIDPAAVEHIHPSNTRRIVRALEVWHATGRPFSYWQRRTPVPYDVVRLGLTCEREELYRRIDGRVDQMMADGLVDEVQDLVARGYDWALPSMSSLGYRQLGEYLRGECTLPDAVQRIKFATHRYARQQYAWFRPGDPAIAWFQASGSPRDVADGILETITEGVASSLN